MKQETLKSIAKSIRQLHKIVESYNIFSDIGTLERCKETCFSFITGTATMECVLQNLLACDSPDYEKKIRQAQDFFSHMVEHSAGNHFQQFILNDFNSIVDGHYMSETMEESYEMQA